MVNLATSVYGQLNIMPHWYALHTQYRHEKKVHERLVIKGVTSYLPLNTVYHTWSDRKRKVEEPMFSCYVFVCIPLQHRLRVLDTHGAVQLVSFNGIPAAIPDGQIEAIRQLGDIKQPVYHTDYYIEGSKVRVVRGPLKGVEGVFCTVKNNGRLVIGIECIQRAVAVEIAYQDVELIEAGRKCGIIARH